MVESAKKFPCPVCARPLDVRQSTKDKPYLVCDPCGVQLFIRGPAGVDEFKRLLEHGNRASVLTRLKEMEERYRLTCPECGGSFWADPKLLKTSVFDGSVKGFRCPQKGCDSVVPWGEKQ